MECLLNEKYGFDVERYKNDWALYRKLIDCTDNDGERLGEVVARLRNFGAQV